MNFIQMLFYAVPLLSLVVAIMYDVFKIKEMKNESNNINQQTTRDDKSTLEKNGFKSSADYDERRRNLYFPN